MRSSFALKMNPLTAQLLNRLWQGEPSFQTVASRLAKEAQSLTPAEAAVIGRDLILRRRALYTRDFNLAAYLASDGIAGNDGFMDFTDCAALLPEERYQRILANPDELIDDGVSTGFDELHLIGEVTKVFDRAILDGDEDGGLLDYLVLGDDEIDWSLIHGATEEDARSRLPRLHERFGHLLSERKSLGGSTGGDRATLEDLIGSTDHPRLKD
jgi:hypothetical protein